MIERVVTLTCDRCWGTSASESLPIEGTTVAEVKAKARVEGWTLGQDHHCGCDIEPWR